MGHEGFARQIGGQSMYKAVKTAEQTGQTMLGAGQECIVLPHEKNGKLVVAIHYQGLSRYSARILYYQQRILSTLFPHNFVPFYMTYPSNEDNKSGFSVRTKITGLGGTNLTHDPHSNVAGPTADMAAAKWKRDAVIAAYEEHKKKVKYSIEGAMNGLQEIGFPFEPDLNVVNRMVAEDGSEFYVDTSGFYTLPRRLKTERILLSMAVRGYSGEAQAIVRNCIERMKAEEERE